MILNLEYLERAMHRYRWRHQLNETPFMGLSHHAQDEIIDEAFRLQEACKCPNHK